MNLQKNLGLPSSLPLPGKTVSALDYSLENALTPKKKILFNSQIETPETKQEESSCKSSGINFRNVNRYLDDSPFLLGKNPNSKPQRHETNPRKPITGKHSKRDVVAPEEVSSMDEDEFDYEDCIPSPVVGSSKCELLHEQCMTNYPGEMLMEKPDSPGFSPMQTGFIFSRRSRLFHLDRHSPRTTSTPYNKGSKPVVQPNPSKEFVDNSRRSLFRRKEDEESSAMDVSYRQRRNDSNVSNDNVSMLSWNEGTSHLIGDFSGGFTLPLCQSKHSDLKSISSETLSDVLRGSYDAALGGYVVIDCRYPYEYQGGHIKDAINICVVEDLLKRFFDNPSTERLVIIFHCEFSSERAPKMMRFLRNYDRKENASVFPHLFYPELYLLDGGYSTFFVASPELCDPSSYLPMLHPDHLEDLKVFQSKRRLGEDEIAQTFFAQRF